jgi:hypothetical protein
MAKTQTTHKMPNGSIMKGKMTPSMKPKAPAKKKKC